MCWRMHGPGHITQAGKAKEMLPAIWLFPFTSSILAGSDWKLGVLSSGEPLTEQRPSCAFLSDTFSVVCYWGVREHISSVKDKWLMKPLRGTTNERELEG